MAKFLDTTGLTHFWGKIKTLLSGKADAEHDHDAATTSANGYMTAAMVTKLNGIATGATNVTVDSALSETSTNPVQNKVLNGYITTLNNFMVDTVPLTYAKKTDLNDYAKKTDISTAYKACGSVSAVPDTAAEDYEIGDVFNVTTAFTTTSSFVEGAGHQYPAGTNIVIVEIDSVRKWDVLAGFVDLSSYATNDDISDLQDQIDNIESVTGSIESITTTEIDTMMSA